MAHIRTAADDPTGEYYPEWLRVIHTSNDIEPGMFGKPDYLGAWWAGGSVEEYPDARVLHRGDGSVSVVSKTERGDRVLCEAAKRLGIHHN